MYLTSGAKVRTRRSQSARSFVRRYSSQSARASSDDRRRFVAVRGGILDVLLMGAGRGVGDLAPIGRRGGYVISRFQNMDVCREKPSPVLGMAPQGIGAPTDHPG